MTGTVSRRVALKGLGLAVAGGLVSARAAGADQTVTVALDPDYVSVAPGETATVDIVVRGATDGISSYRDIQITVQTAAASIVEFEETRQGMHLSQITDDGRELHLGAALLDDTHPGADEIVLATMSVRGEHSGSPGLAVTGGRLFDDDVREYETAGESGSFVVGTGVPVEATFEWVPSAPTVGEAVTFDASETAGNNVVFEWDFGATGTVDVQTDDASTTHVFDRAGTTAVHLSVVDGAGTTDSVLREVPVEAAPREPPTAEFEVQPGEPAVGETVTFDASGSTVREGEIVAYRWDIGADGTVDMETTDPAVEDAFQSPGTVTVALEVEDDTGATDRTERTVAVAEPAPDPPGAALEWTPTEPAVEEVVTLDASGSTGDIVTYRWDFTDDGTVEETTAEPTVSTSFTESGEQTVTVTVVDSLDRTAAVEVVFDVRDDTGEGNGDGDNGDGDNGDGDNGDGYNGDGDNGDDESHSDSDNGEGDSDQRADDGSDTGAGTDAGDEADRDDGADDDQEDGTDGFGPGLDVVSGLAGIGGVAYLLGRGRSARKGTDRSD